MSVELMLVLHLQSIFIPAVVFNPAVLLHQEHIKVDTTMPTLYLHPHKPINTGQIHDTLEDLIPASFAHDVINRGGLVNST
jgi:hypothetical protein